LEGDELKLASGEENRHQAAIVLRPDAASTGGTKHHQQILQGLDWSDTSLLTRLRHRNEVTLQTGQLLCRSPCQQQLAKIGSRHGSNQATPSGSIISCNRLVLGALSVSSSNCWLRSLLLRLLLACLTRLRWPSILCLCWWLLLMLLWRRRERDCLLGDQSWLRSPWQSRLSRWRQQYWWTRFWACGGWRLCCRPGQLCCHEWRLRELRSQVIRGRQRLPALKTLLLLLLLLWRLHPRSRCSSTALAGITAVLLLPLLALLLLP
jgi:hypothetical protein